MGFVMPPLLQSAQLKPDVTITSADSDAEFDEDDDRCPFSSGYCILGHKIDIHVITSCDVFLDPFYSLFHFNVQSFLLFEFLHLPLF